MHNKDKPRWWCAVVAVAVAVAAAVTVAVAVAVAMAVVAGTVVVVVVVGAAAFRVSPRRDDRLEKTLLLLSGCGASRAHSQHHRLPQLSIEVWVG